MVRLKTPSYPPPTLLPANNGDIAALVQITIAAKRPDLLFHFRDGSTSHFELFKRLSIFFLHRFDDPGSEVVKAVDSESGKITAFAVWERWGYSPSLGSKREIDWLGSLHCGGGGDEKPSPLDRYIDAQTKKFEADWCAGVKFLLLSLLMTDPAFQRRGIGTALLEWGHGLADREEVPSFLCATPFGFPLYREVGWKEIGSGIGIDFTKWVPGAEGGDMGWGIYRLRFMLRLCRSLEDTG